MPAPRRPRHLAPARAHPTVTGPPFPRTTRRAVRRCPPTDQGRHTLSAEGTTSPLLLPAAASSSFQAGPGLLKALAGTDKRPGLPQRGSRRRGRFHPGHQPRPRLAAAPLAATVLIAAALHIRWARAGRPGGIEDVEAQAESA